MKRKQEYFSPKVKVVSFVIERGFAGSGEMEVKGDDDSNSIEDLQEKDYGTHDFWGTSTT